MNDRFFCRSKPLLELSFTFATDNFALILVSRFSMWLRYATIRAFERRNEDAGATK